VAATVPVSAVVVPSSAALPAALLMLSLTVKLPPVALATSSAAFGTTRAHSTAPSGLGSPEATDCGNL
jgi:hypothetical protein